MTLVQSYTETQHALDVYETITVVQSFSDYFQGTKTGTTVTGTLDACRPAGYQFTGKHTSSSYTLTFLNTRTPRHSSLFLFNNSIVL
jgi:hypothetical protein